MKTRRLLLAFCVLGPVSALTGGLSGCQKTGAEPAAGVAPGTAPTTAPTTAPSTAEIVAHAPSFQVVLDISRSSPALDQDFMNSVALVIVNALKAMPVGTLVSVNTVGDATVMTALAQMRIQARGTTASDVARKLERLLTGFPEQAKGKEQGRSDLVGGFADAAVAINRNSGANQIYVVSDLVEYSFVADCTRGKRCLLPAKPLFDLSQAKVHVFGVGQGLPSDRAMQLTQDWRDFLARAKARDAELRRL